MDLAKLLNPEQLKAVEAAEGPVLILAGAGSGKTRVITYRVAHLIEHLDVRPEQILAVTFTNKAADQMKFRVRNLLRAARSGDPLISTFHSFCVRLLRREIEALNYTREFTIYDEVCFGVLIIWRHYMALATATWYATPTAEGSKLSLAGIWYGYLSLPLFQFLLLRWYFRLFIWTRFLWQVSRIELSLVPTHPDRVGGLGFLTRTVYAFTPL